MVFKFQGPGARRAASEASPTDHLAETDRFCRKDHARQQEEQGGGRCRHRKPYGVFLSTREERLNRDQE